MNAAMQPETEKILAALPDRISDVIEPFARAHPDHPALVQGNVTWSYSELATVVADAALILKHYDIHPGDRVMIVSENSLALVALILAASKIDAWSVVVNPRLSAREIDLIREQRGPAAYFIRSRCPTRRASTRSVTTPTLPCCVGWERSASGS
jgi:long-chain acyl-CoA synthetase